MIIAIPLIFALVGLLLYAFSTNGNLAEVGRVTYFAGIFVTLLKIGEASVSFLR
jgi:hypothetical protein